MSWFAFVKGVCGLREIKPAKQKAQMALQLNKLHLCRGREKSSELGRDRGGLEKNLDKTWSCTAMLTDVPSQGNECVTLLPAPLPSTTGPGKSLPQVPSRASSDFLNSS